jgi:hypothetical protein
MSELRAIPIGHLLLIRVAAVMAAAIPPVFGRDLDGRFKSSGDNRPAASSDKMPRAYQ